MGVAPQTCAVAADRDGDLTAAFDFSDPDKHVVRLPDVTAFEPPVADVESGKFFPDAALSARCRRPARWRCRRRACALPAHCRSRLQADAVANLAGRTVAVTFDNMGTAGACSHVRSPDG